MTNTVIHTFQTSYSVISTYFFSNTGLYWYERLISFVSFYVQFHGYFFCACFGRARTYLRWLAQCNALTCVLNGLTDCAGPEKEKGLFVFMVGWGRGFTNRPGRKRPACSHFGIAKDMKDPCGAGALLPQLPLQWGNHFKNTHSVSNPRETFFTKQQRPPPLKKPGSKFTGSWGAAIFPCCCYC